MVDDFNGPDRFGSHLLVPFKPKWSGKYRVESLEIKGSYAAYIAILLLSITIFIPRGKVWLIFP